MQKAEQTVREFRAFLDNRQRLPEEEQRELAQQDLTAIGLLDEKGDITPYYQHSFQKREEPQELYLLFSCNEWKEYSSMRLVMATSDKSKIIEQIKAEIRADNMEYAGKKKAKAIMEFRMQNYNFESLKYGFVQVIGDGEVL